MRVAVIGPTHPYTGGIAHYTTELTHRLASAGYEVDLVSWASQYPSFLHPGTLRVPGGEPEVRLYPRTRYPLVWWNPVSWWRAGKSLRGYDAVVLVHATTVQVPAYMTLLRAMRAQPDDGAAGPRVAVVAHNVVPHERHRSDAALVRALFSRADAVVVHSEELAALARPLVRARTTVLVGEIPPHLPVGQHQDRHDLDAHEPFEQLLFFGTVRPYKGLDVLLQALVYIPGIKLVVAGDIWSGAGALREQIRSLGLGERVSLRPGYVAGPAIPKLFSDVDALVLPYRSGTASQNVLLAHAMRTPVIATRAGTLGAQVNDGVDGILAEPDDVQSLVGALSRFYAPGSPQRLRAGVPLIDVEAMWSRYVEVLAPALKGVPVAGTRAGR